MKTKHKIILIVAAILVIGVVIGAIVVMSYINNYKNQISEITITNVDLTKVPDGVYSGSCSVLPVAAEVKVTVKEHKITGIDLIKHINGKGKPAEIIPGKVVEAQSLNVDIVSGATASSKVILKAIENALESAVK